MKKVCLVILDGIGENKETKGNAVKLAPMKNYEKIIKESASTLIKASGKEVGLASEKDAGNSEVGHNAIGSGQHIEQGLALIESQIKQGEIFKNEAFLKAAQNTISNGKKFHLIGLLSNGRVHSDIAQLFAILDKLRELGAKNVKIHALLDGRDVPPQSAPQFLKMLDAKLNDFNFDAKLVDVAGRNVLVMDRYETNLDIIKNSYVTYVLGGGTRTKNIYDKLEEIYKENESITDEDVPAFILDESGKIENGDGILLFNYRGDRAIEISEMFVNFKYVPDAKSHLNECVFIGLTQYDSEANLPKNFLVTPPQIKNTLTEFLTAKKIKQFSVTESVKYGHVTYYFNGNRREKFSNEFETWVEIKSDVCLYSEKPKMKAKEIADSLIEQINAGKFNFYKANFSNGDMVGHTGNLNATITACREVDAQLWRVFEACRKNNVALIITSDHGNAEEMIDEKGGRNTKHTANKVWVAVKDFEKPRKIKEGEFGLTNIAATVCVLLGIKPNPVFNESIVE